MNNRFIHCPNCGSDKTRESDLEEEDDGGEGVECEICGWYGMHCELVAAEEE